MGRVTDKIIDLCMTIMMISLSILMVIFTGVVVAMLCSDFKDGFNSSNTVQSEVVKQEAKQ